MSDRGDEDEPVWDGEGTDPWLPARLAALADAVAAEARVFADYLARLIAWLKQVRDRLAANRYDPASIFAEAPAWYESMTEFAETTILDVAETAYGNVTGDQAYPVDMREAARRRTWIRRNQLAQFPDELYVLIQRDTARAIIDGTSGPRLAEQIDAILDTTDTPRWENRATVVARTESIGALNAGRNDGHGEAAWRLGGNFEKVWIATFDTRTRPTHRDADGQRIPLNGLFTVGEARLAHPGDPAGPPGEVIQCRCTTIMVRPGQNIDMARRRA